MTTSSGRHRAISSPIRFVVCVLMLSMSLVLPPVAGAAAQGTGQVSDTTYVTATGQTITWTTAWAINPEQGLSTAQQDLIVLTDGTATVLVHTGGSDPEAVHRLLAGWAGPSTGESTTLDTGTSGGVTYWFERMRVNGVDSGAFTLATSSPTLTVTRYISPIPGFATGMTSAQASIAIDGAPVFPGIGGDGLQAQLKAAASPSAPAAAPTPPSTAAGGLAERTVTVGGATVTYGEGWAYEEEGSTPGEVAMFINVATMPDQMTIAIVGVVPVASSDPTPWLQMFDDALLTEAGVTNPEPLAVQKLPSGNGWSLRVVDTLTPPMAMLSYADVTTNPSEMRLMVLMTDAPGLQTALANTQATIQVDGMPSFAELDPATVQAQRDGTPAPAPSPTPSTANRREVPIPSRGSPLPTMPAAATPTPAPTGNAGQQVTVGNTVVSWTGGWQYDPNSSMDEQATLNQVDVGTGMLKLATYGEFLDQTVTSPQAALEAFASAFFQGAEATNVVEIGAGQLDDGTVWKVYTLDVQGMQLTFLVTVSQAPGGEYIVSTLTGNTDQFAGTISQAQAEILLDGRPAFLAGIDPQVVLGPAA